VACSLIRAGRVTVNGSVHHNPEYAVHLGKDRIEVDRKRIQADAQVYFLLNKPRGVVTTAADEKGRRTVYQFLDPSLPRLSPVGRLDKASEGLLLLTNDSEWAARIASPESQLDKIYHVQVGRVADAALAEAVIKGVASRNGDFLRAKRAYILRGGRRNTWLEIVLDEGRNRHIRRMFEALEIEVLRLVRVRIGPLELGKLAKGGSRPLTAAEKDQIDAALHAHEGAQH